MKKTAVILIVVLGSVGLMASAQGPAPLKLVQKFELPATIKGNFDHFGVDLHGNRLFATAERASAVLVV